MLFTARGGECRAQENRWGQYYSTKRDRLQYWVRIYLSVDCTTFQAPHFLYGKATLRKRKVYYSAGRDGFNYWVGINLSIVSTALSVPCFFSWVWRMSYLILLWRMYYTIDPSLRSRTDCVTGRMLFLWWEWLIYRIIKYARIFFSIEISWTLASRIY
jgi:hypothetical protein